MTDPKQEQILITGGTGFIGSHLVRHLLDLGYTRLRAIHRSSQAPALLPDQQDRLEWVRGDLLDVVFLEEAMQGCTYLIHCAGLISYHKKDSDLLEQQNVIATARLVDAALHAQIQHCIHLSSTAALGRDRHGRMISERSKWENNDLNTAYAISKFRGEQEVWRAAAEGLPVSILHPSMVLGNLDWQSGIGRMFVEVWKGLPYYPSGGNGVVSVQDVVKVIEQLLHRPAENDRYILTAANYSYQKLLSEIAQALGKPAPTKVLPHWQAHLYRYYQRWRNFWQREPVVLTKDSMRNMLHLVQFDNSKSKTQLQIDYRDPREDIQQMAEAFLSLKESGVSP